MKVSWLGLGETAITDRGLNHVARLANVRVLGLNGCTRIGDEGLREIQDMRLELLSLYGTQVSDEGLAHLERMKTLQNLVLSGTRVTDAGLETIGKLTGLK